MCGTRRGVGGPKAEFSCIVASTFSAWVVLVGQPHAPWAPGLGPQRGLAVSRGVRVTHVTSGFRHKGRRPAEARTEGS